MGFEDIKKLGQDGCLNINEELLKGVYEYAPDSVDRLMNLYEIFANDEADAIGELLEEAGNSDKLTNEQKEELKKIFEGDLPEEEI